MSRQVVCFQLTLFMCVDFDDLSTVVQPRSVRKLMVTQTVLDFTRLCHYDHGECFLVLTAWENCMRGSIIFLYGTSDSFFCVDP